MALEQDCFYITERLLMGRKESNKTNKQNHELNAYLGCCTMPIQWCSQNAEKVMHIKGRVLYKAVIHFNCVPYDMENHFYHIR